MNIRINICCNISSGNILGFKYSNPYTVYEITYGYYNDRNFAKRQHYYSTTSKFQHYAFDKMNQLIYSGPSQSTAEQLHWDGTSGNKTLQTVQYDKFGQKTYVEGITHTGTSINYDADGIVANPDSVWTINELLKKEQQIRYNSRNRVEMFRLDNDSLLFSYRPDTSKWRTRYYEDGTLKYTKYHFGNHEKFVYPNGNTRNLFYIFGGNEVRGILEDNNGTKQLHYVVSDHLGTIWALMDENGTLTEKYAYDPWGRRINPDNWEEADTRTSFITDRGFTLHEHYDHMQVINMNARMYDPLLGQFMSVDPMADLYPGWSPYVYCANNPLKYVDPTGEDFTTTINHEDKTITFIQTILSNKITEGMEKAQNNWKAQNGKFNYVVGDENYSINFEVKYNELNSKDFNTCTFLPDNHKVFDNHQDAGGISNGQDIAIKDSYKNDGMVNTHEMGHNFGMSHTRGIMDEEGGSELAKESVEESLKESDIIEKEEDEDVGNGEMKELITIGEAPEDFNNGILEENEDWEYIFEW